MDLFLICISAFIAAILTFFSGFGLGTILTPVFMVFFPTDLAIALTGVVHFFNNIFKLILVGKYADLQVLWRFGVIAVLAAIPGSLLLFHINTWESWYSYELFGKIFEVFPLKILIAVLLIIFAVMDLWPRMSKISFNKNLLPLGGFLSGFFGGLSGNQGALRSAFLIKAGLSKEAFIGTAVVVSSFVDFTRLSIYATRIDSIGISDNIGILTFVTLSAIAGAFLGNKLLQKVTIRFLQIVVAILLIVLSIALGAGWV